MKTMRVTALAIALAALAGTAQAQDAAAFYRGRTIQAVVGYPPGSTFELYLRLFSQHLARHVPGQPNIIIQHMPGTGSLQATGYLATGAAKDGLVIGLPNQVNSLPPLIEPE